MDTPTTQKTRCWWTKMASPIALLSSLGRHWVDTLTRSPQVSPSTIQPKMAASVTVFDIQSEIGLSFELPQEVSPAKMNGSPYSYPHQLPRLVGGPERTLKAPTMASKDVMLPIPHGHEALELDYLRRSNGSCSICSLGPATLRGGCMARGRGCSRLKICAGCGLAFHTSRTWSLRGAVRVRVCGNAFGVGLALFSEQVTFTPSRRRRCSGFRWGYDLVLDHDATSSNTAGVLVSLFCSVAPADATRSSCRGVDFVQFYSAGAPTGFTPGSE